MAREVVARSRTHSMPNMPAWVSNAPFEDTRGAASPRSVTIQVRSVAITAVDIFFFLPESRKDTP